MRAPNLARHPFVNRRPIRRLTWLLWVLAVGLLAVDGWLYWGYFAGQGRQQIELEELEAKAAEESRRLQEALVALDDFDIDWQRQQITFLNAKIADRTFSWSALFDHLSEVLPRDVRVERVTPQRATSQRSRRRRGQNIGDDEVTLELTGVAERDEALLVLVDGFFAHERFRRPSLKVESRNDQGNEVSFSMSVSYEPPSPAEMTDGAQTAMAPVNAPATLSSTVAP